MSVKRGNKVDRLLSYLRVDELTVKQIANRLKVTPAGVYQLVYLLRLEGWKIFQESRANSKGAVTRRYCLANWN